MRIVPACTVSSQVSPDCPEIEFSKVYSSKSGPVFFFFSYFFCFFFVFFVVLGSVATTTHTGISLRAEAAHSVNRCVPLYAEAAQRLQLAAGVGGGRSPANTVLASWVWKGLACFQAQCSHHGLGRASHALKRALPGLKKAGGGEGGGVGGGRWEGLRPAKKKKWGGGGAAPPICKHSVRIMGLEGLACFQASVARLKKSGGLGGGRSPPICKHSARIMGLEGPRMLSSTVLASWVWKGLACFEASVARLKKSGGLGGGGGGGWGGGAQPPPFANTVLASWVWKASHALKQALPGLKKAGGGGGVGGGAALVALHPKP